MAALSEAPPAPYGFVGRQHLPRGTAEPPGQTQPLLAGVLGRRPSAWQLEASPRDWTHAALWWRERPVINPQVAEILQE